MQSVNSLTYQQDHIRFNDFYGKLISIFDYASETAKLFSVDIEKVHEVTYLLILSRAGKRLDLRGMHKLHAFAISYHNMAFVCMMPSRGGKSTLLLELLKYDNVKLISDDIPLTSGGKIYSFPLKIGIDHLSTDAIKIEDKENNIYQMHREHFGTKTFICLKGLSGKIEEQNTSFDKVILAEAFRLNAGESYIIPSTWMKTFKGLFKHGIIGVGTPIVIEYFWEFGISDFFTKTEIFFRRLWNFILLCSKSRRLTLYQGRKPELLAKKIIQYLDHIKESNA